MVEFYATHAIGYINNLKAEIRKEQEKVAALRREASAGGIQKIAAYPSLPNDIKRLGSPAKARDAIHAAKAEADKLRVVNEKAIATNQAVLREALAYLSNLGLPEKVSRWNGRKRKYESETAEWGAMIQAGIPLHDGWTAYCENASRLLKGCDDWEKQYEADKRREEYARQAEEKAKARAAVVAVLADKYGLPITSTFSDVLDAILGRDKYLCLAYWLQRNRGDWNDGPSYAERGLRQFTVDDQQDREVHDEIRGYIDDWDGDGRIFRDCEWNYSRLFAVASEREPEVAKDYDRLMEHASGEDES